MKKIILFSLLSLLVAIPAMAQTNGLGTGDLTNSTTEIIEWAIGLIVIICAPLSIFSLIKYSVEKIKLRRLNEAHQEKDAEHIKISEEINKQAKKYRLIMIVSMVIIIIALLLWGFVAFPVCC